MITGGSRGLGLALARRLAQENAKLAILARLINNAGEIVVGPLDAMEIKDFKDALDIHFWAPFNVIFASLAYPLWRLKLA